MILDMTDGLAGDEQEQLLDFMCRNRKGAERGEQSDESAMPFIARMFRASMHIQAAKSDSSLTITEQHKRVDALQEERMTAARDLGNKIPRYRAIVNNDNAARILERCIHYRAHWRPTPVFGHAFLNDGLSTHMHVRSIMAFYCLASLTF